MGQGKRDVLRWQPNYWHATWEDPQNHGSLSTGLGEGKAKSNDSVQLYTKWDTVM